MSVTTFARRHPLRLVVLLEAGVVAVFLGAMLGVRGVFSTLGPSDLDLAAIGAGYAVLAVGTVILLTRLGWWSVAGFRRPRHWYYVFLFWLPILPVALNLAGGMDVAAVAPWRIATFLAVSLLVGFVEEGIFRGVMLRALSARGPWIAAMVSSALWPGTLRQPGDG